MKTVRSDINFPEMEREVLSFWKDKKIFQKSNDQRKQKSKKEFTFYDGPPFANGLPHYGHLLANTVKDVVPRYWNMRGYYVERRFGWDCHGVPVEYEIEKRDQLKGRASILEIGIAEFNRRCKESVLHYAAEWEKTITRLGRWVDWNNQYRTMDRSFMESVWWVFSELHNKNLVYRGFKVVPYSPRLNAVLSNFEANQNYKMTQDPSVVVKFKIGTGDLKNSILLAWTTTPWTLISNLALCVHPDVIYQQIKDPSTQEIFILAKDLVAANFDPKTRPVEVLQEFPGSKLVGIFYEPLFEYFLNHKKLNPKTFSVLSDNYVSTTDGTGIVHMSPAYGEDDFRICQKAGIDFVDPLDEEGKFKAVVPDFAGQFLKDADKDILKKLKAENKVFRHGTIDHSYPFCERTDAPLIYRAIPAWYVGVEKIVPNLVANNQRIRWVPHHLKDGRMGKWLENARDWAISRNRYWGTPLPIWVNDQNMDEIEVFGSIAALEERSGQKFPDIHKQFIDQVTFPAKSGTGTMKRVEEVFDCWFESGAMPYAQIHYPFENKERFEQNFPADFIAEGLDQTRGWFYTLAVLSTALFNKPAFKNVIVNGVILDEHGRKMSKRHRNYTPPDLLLEKYGADATRLYMLSSSILRGEDLIFSDKGVLEVIRSTLLPFWNVLSFLTTYAEAESWQPSAEDISGKAPSSKNELDQWILSKLHTLIQNIHVQMEAYQLYAVVPLIIGFMDDLTNWYVRLNRRRFWSSIATEDAQSAYKTLFHVLLQLSKVLAPYAPFISERVYEQLVGSTEKSVHLENMPQVDATALKPDLERRINLMRTSTILGRSLRAKHQIKTRQPLSNMLIITRNPSDAKDIEDSSELISSELNVKKIIFTTEEAKYVRLSVKPNLKVLGKKLGSDVNALRQHLDKLSENHAQIVALLAELETKKSVVLLGHTLELDDFLISRGPLDHRLIASENGVTVLLDTTLDESLISEGIAREFVNRIQNIRKDLNFQVSDRIRINVKSSSDLSTHMKKYMHYIKDETLATEVVNTIDDIQSEKAVELDIEGDKCWVVLERL